MNFCVFTEWVAFKAEDLLGILAESSLTFFMFDQLSDFAAKPHSVTEPIYLAVFMSVSELNIVWLICVFFFYLVVGDSV